jgi:hypothetical protein
VAHPDSTTLTLRGGPVADELRRRAETLGVSPSHMAAVTLAGAWGVDAPPAPKYRPAELASLDVLRAVGDAATVAEVAGSLGIKPEVARHWLKRAKAGGLLTSRRGAWPKERGGSGAVVWRPTNFGRRMASATE